MLTAGKRVLARKRRHARISKKGYGTEERPRLCVSKSLSNMYVQLIDDEKGITLTSASTVDKDLKGKIKNGGNLEAAKIVGGLIAERALGKNIKKVVFDRGGYIYH